MRIERRMGPVTRLDIAPRDLLAELRRLECVRAPAVSERATSERGCRRRTALLGPTQSAAENRFVFDLSRRDDAIGVDLLAQDGRWVHLEPVAEHVGIDLTEIHARVESTVVHFP